MSAFDPKRTLTTPGGFEGGVLTVQPDEHVGGAEDIEVASLAGLGTTATREAASAAVSSGNELRAFDYLARS